MARVSARDEALGWLRVVVGALSQSARTVERRTGVTNAQLFLLQQLGEAGSLSVSELADRARTGQSTVSIILSRLTRAGLVSKKRSPDDARRAVVSLTRRGRALALRAPAPPAADLLRAVDQLSARDARGLADGLAALARALELQAVPPAMLFEAPTS
ncbi:MAG: MarR family transcriptional regulator [Gemmatimonadaceae bacterium]